LFHQPERLEPFAGFLGLGKRGFLGRGVIFFPPEGRGRGRGVSFFPPFGFGRLGLIGFGIGSALRGFILLTQIVTGNKR